MGLILDKPNRTHLYSLWNTACSLRDVAHAFSFCFLAGCVGGVWRLDAVTYRQTMKWCIYDRLLDIDWRQAGTWTKTKKNTDRNKHTVDRSSIFSGRTNYLLFHVQYFALTAWMGECAGFIHTPLGFQPTIQSERLFRTQLTTCTSGAGGRPTQSKHSTLLPFFLCWPHVAKTPDTEV